MTSPATLTSLLVVAATTWCGLTVSLADAAPSPRDELDDLVAEARRLGSRNGASHATEVLAALDASIADAQRHLAAGEATAGLRATERARALMRLASATISRGKAEREAIELHASADARTDEAAAAQRQALVLEAELTQVEAGLQPLSKLKPHPDATPTTGAGPGLRTGSNEGTGTAPSAPASTPTHPETSEP